MRRRRNEGFWRGGFGLAQEAAHTGFGDAVLLGQLADAHPLLSVVEDGFAVYDKRWTAQPPAFQFRPAQARSHSLDNQRSFEFRDGRDDYHHGATQGACGIELFAIRNELNVQMTELIEDLEKCDTDLASRSQAHTNRTSNLPLRASAMS